MYIEKCVICGYHVSVSVNGFHNLSVYAYSHLVHEAVSNGLGAVGSNALY